MSRKVESFVTGFMAAYNNGLSCVLDFRALRTYYKRPDPFLSAMNDRRWHLPPKEFRRLRKTSPCAFLGCEVAERDARQRLKVHALRAAFVTFLCAFPTGWWMLPFMLVDIVFFQREVFLLSQESVMLYKPQSEYGKRKKFVFNYTNLTMLMAKLLESFGVRQIKKGTGKLGNFAVKRGARFIRGPLQLMFRQAMKWFGVTVAKDVVEQSIDCAVVILCATFAGLITYWLFLPMMKRFNALLASDDTDVLDQIVN